ncbi:hypothetical protein SynSYN20_01307 [Synechococcus sp. SYN20]|nr:hypothetical protein SynSYN20_01307 [Synechococcus sp. SYN20]
MDLIYHLPLHDGNQMDACTSGSYLLSDYQTNRGTINSDLTSTDNSLLISSIPSTSQKVISITCFYRH